MYKPKVFNSAIEVRSFKIGKNKLKDNDIFQFGETERIIRFAHYVNWPAVDASCMHDVFVEYFNE